MSDVEITLRLPELLAEQAQAEGVLTNDTLAMLIEMELRRKASLRRLRETANQLQALQPPITPEEIDEEIRQYRAEKMHKHK